MQALLSQPPVRPLRRERTGASMRFLASQAHERARGPEHPRPRVAATIERQVFEPDERFELRFAFIETPKTRSIVRELGLVDSQSSSSTHASRASLE